MKRKFAMLAVLAIICAFTTVALAFSPPCGGSYPTVTKAITVPSAASTVVAAHQGNTTMYVCAIHLLNSGGASTLNYGTGTTCLTGTVNFTGALGSTDLIQQTAQAGEIFKIPAGKDFCVTGASSAAGTGYVTFANVLNLNP